MDGNRHPTVRVCAAGFDEEIDDGEVVYGAITRDSGWDNAATWWRFELMASDITTDKEADEQSMFSEIHFWPRVVVPRQHLAEVQRLMQSYNRQCAE